MITFHLFQANFLPLTQIIKHAISHPVNARNIGRVTQILGSTSTKASWIDILPKIKFTVGTVQLSSKVMFALVSNASHTRSGRASSLAKKGCGTYVRLVAALSRGFALAWTCLACSQTRFARVSDAFGRYLGAELYCTKGRPQFLKVYAIPQGLSQWTRKSPVLDVSVLTEITLFIASKEYTCTCLGNMEQPVSEIP